VNFSNAENMMRLQRCLKGRAKETVGALLSIPDNVEEVVRALERRFGRPEFVISSMIMKVEAMSVVKEEKMNSIIDFSNAVRGLVSTMECLSSLGHMTNPHLIQGLVAKLPPSLRLQWGAIAAVETTIVKTFSNWLANIADAASFVWTPRYVTKPENSANVSQQGKWEYRKHRETTLTVVNKKTASFNCLVCSGSHLIPNCKKLNDMTVDDR